MHCSQPTPFVALFDGMARRSARVGGGRVGGSTSTASVSIIAQCLMMKSASYNFEIVGVTFFALTDIILRNFSPGQGFDRYHMSPKVRKNRLEVYPLRAATLLLSYNHRD